MSPAPRPVLGARFVTIWAGQSLSTLGSMLANVGIGVWVFVETGSAAWLGALAALAAAPMVLMAPLLRWVDRWPRRSVMIWADVVASLGSMIALVLAVVGRLELWHLIVAAFVGGAGTAFQAPAFQAAVPTLVTRDALDRANGLNQFGPALGVVLGPVLATPIVAWWGLEGVLVVDLATFAVAIATVAVVRFGGPSDDWPSSGSPSSDAVDDGSWRAAIGWLRGVGRPVAALMVALAAVNFVVAAFNVALITLAVEIGGVPRSGLVLASGGLAMLAGSIALAVRGLPRRRVAAFASALAAMGVGCWVAASRPTMTALVAGTVLALVAVPALSAIVATVFHERVPAGMQGRVFAVRFAAGQSLGPVGSLVAGFAVAHAANPAMRPGSLGADALGGLIGTGADRGAALILLVVGVALVGLALVLATSSLRESLDGLEGLDGDVATRPVAAPI